MLYGGSDAPYFHVPLSTQGNDISSTDPLAGQEIHIAPIVISHTEVNILKFQLLNSEILNSVKFC